MLRIGQLSRSESETVPMKSRRFLEYPMEGFSSTLKRHEPMLLIIFFKKFKSMIRATHFGYEVFNFTLTHWYQSQLFLQQLYDIADVIES